MNKESIKLYGNGSKSIRLHAFRSLFFKDSMKMFPSPLAELCATKTDEECRVVTETISAIFLSLVIIFAGFTLESIQLQTSDK